VEGVVEGVVDCGAVGGELEEASGGTYGEVEFEFYEGGGCCFGRVRGFQY